MIYRTEKPLSAAKTLTTAEKEDKFVKMWIEERVATGILFESISVFDFFANLIKYLENTEVSNSERRMKMVKEFRSSLGDCFGLSFSGNELFKILRSCCEKVVYTNLTKKEYKKIAKIQEKAVLQRTGIM